VNDGIEKPVNPAIYAPYSLQLWMGTSFLVRTRVAPDTVVQDLRQQLAAVNPNQQADRIIDLETEIRTEPVWARGRLISALFTGFSILALLLSAVGLYSVASYSVAQRTSEFGIRIALGAPRAHLFRVVLASVAASVGIGVVAGLAASLGVGRFLASWAGASVSHPLLITGIALLLLAVAVAACLIPARRALAIDPMVALRRE
jgi:ABC-type antimicrobial peptide transport system permease subunit